MHLAHEPCIPTAPAARGPRARAAGPPAQIAVNCIFAARPASRASLRPKRAVAALSAGHPGVNSGIWVSLLGLCLVSAWSLLARRAHARFRAQFYFSGKTVPVPGQAPPGPGGWARICRVCGALDLRPIYGLPSVSCRFLVGLPLSLVRVSCPYDIVMTASR